MDASAPSANPLRTCRKSKGLTLRELAYFAGCAHTTIARLEREEIDVSPTLKARIAHALGVPVQELWASGLDEPENEPAA